MVEQALDQVRQVLDVHPDYPDMHHRAARLLRLTGDEEAADHHLQQALKLNPRYLDALVLRGQVLVALGRADEAVAHYDRALQVNDSYLEAYAGLAVAYRQMGMDEEADEAIGLAARIEPNSGCLYQEMSRLMLRAAAAGAIGRALNLPHAALGGVVDRLEPEDVLAAELRAHQNAVAQQPNFPDFRYRYGLLLKSAGRLEEALEQFRAAVAINPAYVKALVKLGLTAWEAGRLVEAADALTRAVHLQPQYVDLHYRLGLVYADRGMWPMAVEEYQRAIALQPDAEAVQASLLLALENMGLAGEEAEPAAARPDG
jgi:tetratricopeptide (TPR) repeat protein